MLASRLAWIAESTIAVTLKLAPMARGVRRNVVLPSRTRIGSFMRARRAEATFSSAASRSSPPTSTPPARTPSAIRSLWAASNTIRPPVPTKSTARTDTAKMTERSRTVIPKPVGL